MAKRWFAERSITVESEQVNFKVNSMNDFTINGNPIPMVSPSVAVGATNTLAPGNPATVVNVGTPSAAILDFGIPQGVAGVASLGSIGFTPNANGATLSLDGLLKLQSADASFGGVINTTAQSFSGTKTFNNGIILSATGQSLNSFTSSNQVFTPSLNGGSTITSMTVNGAPSSTITLTFQNLSPFLKKITIPQFQLVSFTGAPDTLQITNVAIPAAFIPTSSIIRTIFVLNGGVTAGDEVVGKVIINTGGFIFFSVFPLTPFTTTFLTAGQTTIEY